MKCTFHNSALWLLAFTFHHFFMPAAGAQSCGFSVGKSLHELQLAVQKPSTPDFLGLSLASNKKVFLDISAPSADVNPKKRSVFLPRWSAEDLPFFCKIEHNWAKNRARIPLKFRLGSVEYVDWLEGKGSY